MIENSSKYNSNFEDQVNSSVVGDNNTVHNYYNQNNPAENENRGVKERNERILDQAANMMGKKAETNTMGKNAATNFVKFLINLMNTK